MPVPDPTLPDPARLNPARLLADLAAAIRFFTRIPLPERIPHTRPDMEAMAPMLPLVGALVGLIGLIVHLIGLTLHLGPLVSAILAVAAMTVATGALHEDGLADCADALGAGNPARRLEIMKDSRVGAFGVLALIFLIFLKVSAISGLSAAGWGASGAAIVAAAGLSRLGGIWVLHLLPAARADGASASAGRTSRHAALLAAASAVVIAGALVIPYYGVAAAIVALAASCLCFQGVTIMARRLIGGQTGDVAGAAIAVGEIAFLLALLIFAAPN